MILQKNEWLRIRRDMWKQVVANDPSALADMTEQYAMMMLSMIGGYDKKLDDEIQCVVSKLSDIAMGTRLGSIDADSSYYLSCAYVDEFVVGTFSPWMRMMYGNDVVSHSIWKSVTVGKA